MLTFREEIELTAVHEQHLACAIGWIVSACFVILWLSVATLGDRPWFFQLAGVSALIGLAFFRLSRRLLRRIRHLEQFK